MLKTKWKSKRWKIVFISEKKYNPYLNVDENKKRPVMIWNNSLSLNGKVICFYCTSKYKENKEQFMFLANGYNSSKVDTWVDISKIFYVDIRDIDWYETWGTVYNWESRDLIREYLQKYFC